MIPEAFSNVIHFVVELLKTGQFRSLFCIDRVTFDVFSMKLDGRLVDFGVEAAH